MKFSIEREKLLKPLQIAVNVTEKRQTMPILSNLLFVLKTQALHITATDSEVEVLSYLSLDQPVELGEVTIPARKVLDLCRNLPESAEITFELNKERVLIRSEKSRFTLSTLPASDFPHFSDGLSKREFSISAATLKDMIDQTQFSMAQQDVRYYLNGVLLEVTQDNTLRTVATDGHRLAMSWTPLNSDLSIEPIQVIIPRKGIVELSRLLGDSDGECLLTIGDHFIRVNMGTFTFTSKLVDARFPDVQHKLPQLGDFFIQVDRDALKQRLQRLSILTTEKYRGVRLQFSAGQLTALIHNPEQEEAEEELAIHYTDDPIEIGFNVAYLLEALNALPMGNIELAIVDVNKSILIRSLTEKNSVTQSLYLVMPMRI